MRLIDADALLEAVNKIFEVGDNEHVDDVIYLITNAPTVQREGWKLIGEPGEYDTVYECPKCGTRYLEQADGELSCINRHTCKCGFSAAPTDKE